MSNDADNDKLLTTESLSSCLDCKRKVRKMNDKEICKKCIYYDDFCCRNDKAICVNNSEYMDAETYINAIINRKERAKNE